jgi:hypothetical protein
MMLYRDHIREGNSGGKGSPHGNVSAISVLGGPITFSLIFRFSKKQ